MFGLDISKDFFDLAFLAPDFSCTHKRFAQSPQGFEQALAWMDKHDPEQQCPAVFEYTGKLWLSLSCALQQAARQVVALPSDVLSDEVRKMFEGRAKTDAQDAKLLAHYGEFLAQRGRLHTLSVPSEEDIETLEMQRYISTLIERKTGLKLSLQQALSTRFKQELKRDITGLEKRIHRLREQLLERVKQNEQMSKTQKLLTSIPGIAAWTALVLMNEIGDIERFEDANHLVSWVGLCPNRKESGQSRKRSRIAQGGNGAVRKAMYVSSLSARTYNPCIKQMHERLKKETKLAGTQISVALGHKLLRQVYGVWTSGKPFDPTYHLKRMQTKAV